MTHSFDHCVIILEDRGRWEGNTSTTWPAPLTSISAVRSYSEHRTEFLLLETIVSTTMSFYMLLSKTAQEVAWVYQEVCELFMDFSRGPIVKLPGTDLT